jgi:hypothetical protein
MQTIVIILVAFVREMAMSRATLQLENIALRQQVAVLKRERPRPRPRLHPLDRVFWVFLSRLWPRWKDALVIVKPETVVGWHRLGFRLFWKWKSCHGKPGRPRTSREIRELIQRMSRENPLWGAPRIHGELLKLGIDVSQATVTRYMVRHPKPPSQTWRTFLDNHSGCLVSIDFFVVPTATFAVLFVFIVLRHERRRIEHFRRHRTSDRRLGGTADSRSLSVGHGAALSDPRPGRRIRAIVPLDGDGDGCGRGRHGTKKPVAESVCGTPDRQRETRMPEPRDHSE